MVTLDLKAVRCATSMVVAFAYGDTIAILGQEGSAAEACSVWGIRLGHRGFYVCLSRYATCGRMPPVVPPMPEPITTQSVSWLRDPVDPPKVSARSDKHIGDLNWCCLKLGFSLGDCPLFAWFALLVFLRCS